MSGTELWPFGAGEMAGRIRDYPWNETSLGASRDWPASMRATVDLVLAHAFPMAALWGPDLVQIYNDAFHRILRQQQPQPLGQTSRQSWPEAWAEDEPLLVRAQAGETLTVADRRCRIADEGEGREAWFTQTYSPLRDEAGDIAGILLTAFDVTEHHAGGEAQNSEDPQRLLVFEQQHRIRNTLAVIRSIIRRTAAATEDRDDMLMHLEGRIDAFARVRAAATRTPGRGVDLAILIADELRVAGAHEGPRLSISGPSIALVPRAAEAIGLAIHELTTNAIKFGVLSSEDHGRLEIDWTLDPVADPARLRFSWREQRPASSAPGRAHKGFGTEILTRTLPYELKAETQMRHDPQGTEVRINFPLEEIMQPAAGSGGAFSPR